MNVSNLYSDVESLNQRVDVNEGNLTVLAENQQNIIEFLKGFMVW